MSFSCSSSLSVYQKPVREAIERCINASFPTASFSFNGSFFTSTEPNIPAVMTSLSGELGKPFFIPALTTFPSNESAAWESLYRVRGKLATLTKASKQPFQWVEQSTIAVPSWAPHGVIFIGGYHSMDLVSVVVPQILENVQTLERSATESSCWSTLRTKQPSYMKSSNTNVTMLSKGCKVLGRDLIEISIPLSSLHTESSSPSPLIDSPIRIQLLFANPSTMMRELNAAVSPSKRNELRGAFGYCIPLLREALPPALVEGTRMLRGWQSTWEDRRATSSAFWVSLLAHASFREPQAALPRETHWDTSRVVSRALELADKGAPKIMQNYFLPEESFVSCEDVIPVLQRRGKLLDAFNNFSK